MCIRDSSFVSTDHETIDGPTALKTGTRPALVESDAFNTSSDFGRIKLATFVDGDAAPSSLFAYVTEMALNINNNVTPNKAIGKLGAFATTIGTFAVSGTMTAYFSNVSAIQAVRSNADVSLDFFITHGNTGMVMDLPLVGLGDGRLNIELDRPITLPIGMDAARGTEVSENIDHTLLISVFDYLPDVAE